MKLALDYDDTYTLDPEFWDVFLSNARHRGHKVYIVTMRYPEEAVHEYASMRADRVVYTSRKAKRPHLRALGLEIDVWIDDSPEFVLFDANDATLADLHHKGS